MLDSSYQIVSAIDNHQGVFDGFNINGVRYQVVKGARGWHLTVFPGKDPVNVYWFYNHRFYAAKVDIETEPISRISLEVCEEITFIPHEERTAIFKAIAEWEKH
ncbi:MAG: hypothetical protein KGN79_12885 [Acidobacteriota bacterium]|nr:hypothetical protein [Acidobacteriota bacterium]